MGCGRYTEAYEREWRQKEKAAREHVAATNRDLAQARAAQQAARVAAQADMAHLEAQEFHRVLEENRQKEHQRLEQVTIVSVLLVWQDCRLAIGNTYCRCWICPG